MDVDRLFAEQQKAGRSVLTEVHAKDILRAWGLRSRRVRKPSIWNKPRRTQPGSGTRSS